MGNISHLEKEMVKVIVVKTARQRVCTVSAGWRGDRRRQICHRILKFAFYKCSQKVTVLLLCSSLPHLNLIKTALCKIWDCWGLVGWRPEVASCSCCWLDSNSSIYWRHSRASNNIHWHWSQWKSCKDCLPIHLSVCSSHPLVWLVFIICDTFSLVSFTWKKGCGELLLCISVFSKLWGPGQ